MSNTIVILGNGFDLDLGWKTSYKDFLTSNKFSIMGEPRYVMKYTKQLFRRMGNNGMILKVLCEIVLKKRPRKNLMH